MGDLSIYTSIYLSMLAVPTKTHLGKFSPNFLTHNAILTNDHPTSDKVSSQNFRPIRLEKLTLTRWRISDLQGGRNRV